MFYRSDSFPISSSIYEGVVGITAIKLNAGDMNIPKRIREKPYWSDPAGGSGIYSGNFNPFFIYPTAWAMKVLGYSGGHGHISLRFASMAYGILAVLMICLLGRVMFFPWIGLGAGVIMGGAVWHLAYSRIAADTSATVLYFLVCLWLYFTLENRDKLNPWIKSGGFMFLGGLLSLATWFYIPARSAAGLVFLAVGMNAVLNEGWLRRNWENVCLLVVGFVLALVAQAAPGVRGDHSFLWRIGDALEMFFIRNTGATFTPWYRQADTISQLVSNAGEVWKLFAGGVGTWTVSAVAERGGGFDYLTGICMLAGLAWSFYYLGDRNFRFLIIWLAVGFLPMILTCGEERRGLIAAPAVYLLASVGIFQTTKAGVMLVFPMKSGKLRLPVAVITVSLALASVLVPAIIARNNISAYFGMYQEAAKNPRNKFVIRRMKQEDLIRLARIAPVITDQFSTENGWPQVVEFDLIRKGLSPDRIKIYSTEKAKAEFMESTDSPAILWIERDGIIKK
jgi:hypothetical protein